MPTFSCPQCGAAFTASHKPKACSQCGGRQIRTSRNGGSSSGNLTQPKFRRSPISEPKPALESNPLGVEAQTVNPQRVKPRTGGGMGFKIFDPSLIMTWLLVLSPLALALGYALYRLASLQLVTTGFIHRLVQEDFDQPASHWRSSGNSQVIEGQLRHRQTTGRNQSTLADVTVSDSAVLTEIDGFEEDAQGKVAGVMARVSPKQGNDGY